MQNTTFIITITIIVFLLYIHIKHKISDLNKDFLKMNMIVSQIEADIAEIKSHYPQDTGF